MSCTCTTRCNNPARLSLRPIPSRQAGPTVSLQPAAPYPTPTPETHQPQTHTPLRASLANTPHGTHPSHWEDSTASSRCQCTPTGQRSMPCGCPWTATQAIADRNQGGKGLRARAVTSPTRPTLDNPLNSINISKSHRVSLPYLVPRSIRCRVIQQHDTGSCVLLLRQLKWPIYPSFHQGGPRGLRRKHRRRKAQSQATSHKPHCHKILSHSRRQSGMPRKTKHSH
jgi:hypothetical protein